jgi:ATP-dependent protease HslVU (ClpYQ) peptidase subunit
VTTVAYRDGVMACDSCWTYGGTVDTLANKITRLSSGALLGQAGQNDGRAMVALLDKVKTPAQIPSYDALMNMRVDFLGLLVLPKGRIFKVSTTHIAPSNWGTDFDTDIGMWEITGLFSSVGSGGDLATAAMDCGKSARDAVRVACKYDPNSRPPVHIVSLAQKVGK